MTESEVESTADVERAALAALARLARGTHGLGEIATLLERQCMHGKMAKSCECPIAKYLLWAVQAERVVVGHCYIAIHTAAGRDIRLDTPQWVDAFILEFDQGVYPALIERESDANQRDTGVLPTDA
jgi:hypothetical protein